MNNISRDHIVVGHVLVMESVSGAMVPPRSSKRNAVEGMWFTWFVSLLLAYNLFVDSSSSTGATHAVVIFDCDSLIAVIRISHMVTSDNETCVVKWLSGRLSGNIIFEGIEIL